MISSFQSSPATDLPSNDLLVLARLIDLNLSPPRFPCVTSVTPYQLGIIAKMPSMWQGSATMTTESKHLE